MAGNDKIYLNSNLDEQILRNAGHDELDDAVRRTNERRPDGVGSESERCLRSAWRIDADTVRSASGCVGAVTRSGSDGVESKVSEVLND